MSMYQIEDLVEASIRRLCQVVSDPYQLRNDIHYLYEFQNQFDCSFTQLRVLRELLNCGFVIPIQPHEHPMYIQKRECFDRLVQEDFDYTPGPSGGYWCGVIEGTNGEQCVLNKFFCDYGSPLWAQMVEEGKFSGEFACPLLPLNPYELLLRILRSSPVEEDAFLVYYWYAMFPLMIEIMGNPEEIEDEVKAELKSLLCRPEIFGVLKEDISMALQEDDYLEDEFAEEWFAPYFEWCNTIDSDPEQLSRQIIDLFTKGDYRATLELAEKGMYLKTSAPFFCLFWASALVMLQIREMMPSEPENNKKAIRIFQLSMEYQEEETAKESIFYYMAMAYLVEKEFEAAEDAISKITILFKQNPALLEDYRNLEKKWRELD